jgi:hypothetical protein
MLWGSAREQGRHEATQKLKARGWCSEACHYAEGQKPALHMALVHMEAKGKGRGRKQYLEDFLADMMTHEVGHCLGLRHNFVASTYLSTASLMNAGSATTASVMDYTPVNFVNIERGVGSLFGDQLGPYDHWAIRYGYSQIKGDSTVGERSELAKIASLSGKHGLEFATDENSDREDPFVAKFDLGNDPLEFSGYIVRSAKRVRQYAIDRLPRPGESYRQRTNLILSSYTQTVLEARKATRFIGGTRLSRNFRGDAGEKASFRPVDAKVQRRALSFVVQNCLKPGAMDLPPHVLATLGQEGNLSLNDAAESQGNWTAPVRTLLSSFQSLLLSGLLATTKLDAIAENEYKQSIDPSRYSLGEHYGAVVGAVFQEIGRDQNVTPLRRDLQQQALIFLTAQAGDATGAINTDARLVANDVLRRLLARIHAQMARKQSLDSMTRLHLQESAAQIKRFFSRSVAGSRA